MSDSTIIILALIATIAPTLASILTWLSSRSKIEQVHKVVNSNTERLEAHLAEARATNKVLEAEIARRHAPGAEPTPATTAAPVTISDEGAVTVEKRAPAAPGDATPSLPIPLPVKLVP